MNKAQIDLLVDQPGRRQFGDEAKAELLIEPSLMVVEALLAFVVHPTDIHDNVAGVKRSRVPGALEIW